MRSVLVLTILLVGANLTPAETARADAPPLLSWDESALPDGGTGWFMIAFRATGTWYVEIESKAVATYTNRTTAHALVVGDGMHVPYVTASGDHDLQDAIAFDGTEVSCCGSVGARQFGGGSRVRVGMHVDAHEVLYAGFVTANWLSDARLTFNISAPTGSIEIVDFTTGTDVRLVDLVDESWRAGRNARALGFGVGAPAPVSGALEFPAGGIAGAACDVAAGGELDFEIVTPDGKRLHDDEEDGCWGWLEGAFDGGSIAWRVDHMRDRQKDIADRRSSRLEAFVLWADMPIPGARGARLDIVY